MNTKMTLEQIQHSIEELSRQIPLLREGSREMASESRRNPLPYAVTGLGLACALGQAVKSALEKPEPKTLKGRIGSVADTARESVVNFADGARERIHDATEAVAEKAHGMRNQLAGGASPADKVREVVREKPFLCSAGVLATGFVAGLIVPPTRSEKRWFGDAGRQILDDAKASGAGVVKETKAIAKETISAADQAVCEAAKETGEAIREKVADI